MEVAILCGGQGIRYRNTFVDRPKALAPIGDVPILWHLFKYFSAYGINDFILCTGHRGNEIQKYVDTLDHTDWNITCVDTGQETPTGGRILKIKDYVKEDVFMATYVDGLSNVDLKALTDFHFAGNQIATLTAVRPKSQYGILNMDDAGVISTFDEKPRMPYYINGGFFVFNKRIFDYLTPDDVLEEDTFNKLITAKEFNAFRHEGFWKSMDTFKENMQLDEMWNADKADWVIW
jgi:glucose-1-phosphate cytidylyltransferase